MVLCENEYFLTSNLLCFFTSARVVVPSSYFTFLNFENNIIINIFITIQYLKGALYRIQILCRRYTFWYYPALLTIVDTPG